MNRDLHNEIKVSPAINPGAAVTGNSTTTSATIDRQGYGSLEFLIQSGTITDGTFTPSMEEGDKSDMSDAAAVAAGDLLGTVAAATFAATDDNKTKKIGYRGSKRYVRLVLTQAGATSGGIVGAVALQGHPRNRPASAGPIPSP